MRRPSSPKTVSHRVKFRRIRVTDQSERGTKIINIKVDKTTGEHAVSTSSTTASKAGKISPQVATSIKSDIGKTT
jgi:hypothetical protein